MLAYLDGFYWCKASVSDAAQKGVLTFKQSATTGFLESLHFPSLYWMRGALHATKLSCTGWGGIKVHGIVIDELASISLGDLLRKDTVRAALWGMSSPAVSAVAPAVEGGEGGVGGLSVNCMVIDQMRVWDLYYSNWVLWDQCNSVLFLNLAQKIRIILFKYSVKYCHNKTLLITCFWV